MKRWNFEFRHAAENGHFFARVTRAGAASRRPYEERANATVDLKHVQIAFAEFLSAVGKPSGARRRIAAKARLILRPRRLA